MVKDSPKSSAAGPASAAALDPFLLDLFRTELEIHSRALEDGLVETEARQEAAKLQTLMRAAHSLKGAARIVGLDTAVRLAHAMEDMLSAAQRGERQLTGADFDLLLRGADVFKGLAASDALGIPAALAAASGEIDELTRQFALPPAASPPAGTDAGREARAAAPVSDLPPGKTPTPAARNSPPQKPGGGAATQSRAEMAAKPTVEKAESAVVKDSSKSSAAGPASAGALDPFLLDLFRTELEIHSRALEDGLVETEARQEAAKLQTLMRAAHSLKGAARIVGLDTAVRLAHAMEDMLSAAQRGERQLTGADFDLLLRGADVFKGLAAGEALGIPAALAAASGKIDELTRQFTLPAAASPPAGADRGIETPQAAPVSDLPPGKAATPAAGTSPPQPSQEAGGAATPSRAESAAKPAVEKAESASVRISVENLNRLSGFAGECLVEVKTLQPLTTRVRRIKQRQAVLSRAVEQALEAIGKEAAAEAQARLGEALEEAAWIDTAIPHYLNDLERFSRKLEHLANRLYEEAVASRMRPFSDALHGFPRMVRDLAKSLGKSVRLGTEGESTRVDRDILEKLEAPLTHLLRNAVDHGIEAQELRARAGKPAEGRVTLSARHAGGVLEIAVADDGGGIGVERVRQRIVERSYAPADLASKLSESEVFEFLFLPGFSTASGVTEISGRGVGLDVVQSMARQVGGNVRVESRLGEGTRFLLQLPLTLSVLRALMLEVKGQPFALPLTRIDRVLSVRSEEVRVVENRQFLDLGGQNLGLVAASQVLELGSSEFSERSLHIVTLGDQLNRYGLVVDRFLGERDLVVIPLPACLGKIPNISAGAILEDGSPVAILDSEDLVRSIDSLLTHGRLLKIGGPGKAEKAGRKRVLVVDDSLTVREVERRLLENRGYEVAVAVDGMDGWNAVQGCRFDLVVTDVDMPRLDGIELVKRIKGLASTRSIPVMIVSYKDQEEYRKLGLEAGASYYLAKSSFHDATLINAVRDLIGEPES